MVLHVCMGETGGFQREVQHYQASETDRLSRIALETPMESEVLALDRIASPAEKPKALNSASVALRAGTRDLQLGEFSMSIDQANYYLDTNNVEGWFQKSAAEILCAMSRKIDMEGRPVSEIGIHHGKLAIFLGLLTGGRLVGFDLFERQDENIDSSGRGNKNKFLQNCCKNGLDKENVLAISVNSMNLTSEKVIDKCGNAPILFSVDGGHTSELTENDLYIAARSISKDGVVMLDDFFNPVFPEVSWGTIKFMKNNPETLFPFCISGGKVFFARERATAEMYAEFLSNIRLGDLKYIMQIDRCIFFGCSVCVMWTYTPPESLRESLTRTTLWRAMKNTPAGAFVRRLAGR